MIDQGADVLNFNFAHVTRLHKLRRLAAPAHTSRCAGGNDITRHQREDGRGIADQFGDGENHVAGVARLLHDTVQSRDQFQFLIGLNLIGEALAMYMKNKDREEAPDSEME